MLFIKNNKKFTNLLFSNTSEILKKMSTIWEFSSKT